MKIIRTHETRPNSQIDSQERMQLSQFELGWVSGLLEGEGAFMVNGKGKIVWLEMTDQDVVLRVRDLLVRITGRYVEPWTNHRQRKYNTQDTYILQIRGKNAELVMRTLVRYMSKRRRGQIWRALNGYKYEKQNVDILELLGANHTDS